MLALFDVRTEMLLTRQSHNIVSATPKFTHTLTHSSADDAIKELSGELFNVNYRGNISRVCHAASECYHSFRLVFTAITG